MENRLNLELLEYLQQAGEEVTRLYHIHTGKLDYQFEVIQFSDISKPNSGSNQDIVRQAAELYDQYEGNEEYIHIPDVGQMESNFRNFPVIGVVNHTTQELEGIMTIKFHNNCQEMDPYYPKEGKQFYSITGAIVRQRKNILNKGLGTGMYETAILGIQKYVQEHPEEEVELNVVIDCTNLPSLYALSNAVQSINTAQLVGKKKQLDSYLEAIYTVKDENSHLVEAPTYVLRVDLEPKENEAAEKNDVVLSFEVEEEKEKYENYQQLLNQILDRIKAGKRPKTHQMEDKGTGYVTYIPVQQFGIYLTDMQVITNGAEKIGAKRTPRNDSAYFIGPIQDIHIERQRNTEEEER